MKRVFNILIAAVVMAAAVMGVWPKARLMALAVAGRSGCPLGPTLGAAGLRTTQDTIAREVGHTSRVARLDGNLALWETPNKGQWWMPAQDIMLPFLLAEQELRIYGSGIRRGDVVLDCGANVGTFTKTALAQGASMVVAIEPSPITLECLRRNLAAEIGIGKVIVAPKAVWNKPGVLQLIQNPHNNGGNSVVTAKSDLPTVDVPLTTIDALVADLGIAKVDFIKMDIEGAEKNALAGAAGTLRRFHPRMAISTEHLSDDVSAIPAAVKEIQPNYRLTYGHCYDLQNKVVPQVAFFE
jgi:FkbM family methyltransferase